MRNFKSKYTSLIATLIIAFIFASCNVSGTNTAPKQVHPVAVKMSVQPTSSTNMIAANRTMQSAYSISSVKLLVDELELESALEQDKLDFQVDDLVVNLPLDGSEFVLTSMAIPEGVYDEFEMEIDKPDDHSINDPDFYNESGEDYSIIVKGVYKGQPFTYRSHEKFKLEMELNPPLKVTTNSTPSIAINVDPYSWFVDDTGNPIDPNDPANRAQIEENIKKSFDAEREDDSNDDDNGNEGENHEDGENNNGSEDD